MELANTYTTLDLDIKDMEKRLKVLREKRGEMRESLHKWMKEFKLQKVTIGKTIIRRSTSKRTKALNAVSIQAVLEAEMGDRVIAGKLAKSLWDAREVVESERLNIRTKKEPDESSGGGGGGKGKTLNI